MIFFLVLVDLFSVVGIVVFVVAIPCVPEHEQDDEEDCEQDCGEDPTETTKKITNKIAERNVAADAEDLEEEPTARHPASCAGRPP